MNSYIYDVHVSDSRDDKEMHEICPEKGKHSKLEWNWKQSRLLDTCMKQQRPS